MGEARVGGGHRASLDASTLTKAVFTGYGLAWLAIVGAFVVGVPWGRTAMLLAAAGALWFLPFGTLLSVLQIGLLLLAR